MDSNTNPATLPQQEPTEGSNSKRRGDAGDDVVIAVIEELAKTHTFAVS